MERDEAKALGLAKYNTGRPCKRGHFADRNTNGWVCVECNVIVKARYSKENAEKIAVYGKKYREENVEKTTARLKKYYKENTKKVSVVGKKYREENKDKISAKGKKYYAENVKRISIKDKKYYKKNTERAAASSKKWRQENPHMHAAKSARYRAAKLKATPSWLNEGDLFFIEEAYHLSVLRSKTTGVKHHVDHVLPLQGKKVCGLHVHWNLSVVPATENISKGNRQCSLH